MLTRSAANHVAEGAYRSAKLVVVQIWCRAEAQDVAAEVCQHAGGAQTSTEIARTG